MRTLISFSQTFFYILTLSVFFSQLSVQAQQKTGKITGAVSNDSNAGVPFVQIDLKNALDSGAVKTVLADERGRFILEVPVGKYFIAFKMMGYGVVQTKVFTVIIGQTVDLGVTVLTPATTELSAVTISIPRPFIERRADKVIVNLNGLGSGAPIMEVMNQFPGVNVTPDDRISLNGKSVQIYIDGKATTLSAEALAGMLKGMSSSSIQKVELVSQPSAKYDAAGNGAIINIIRKRNYKAGLNGNIYIGGGKGAFGKANGGVNLNYKGQYYNILLNMDYNYNKYFYNTFIVSNFTEVQTGTIAQSRSAIKSTRTTANYTPSLGLDFYLSKRTTLSTSIKPGLQSAKRDGLALQINNSSTGMVLSESAFANGVNIRSTNLSVGSHLQHQIDTTGKELTVDFDYYRYGNYNDQENRTVNYNPYSDIPSTETQDRVFDVYALKMDYTYPFGAGRQLEMGLKTSFVNSINTNIYQDNTSRQTDLFNYTESVSALYLTYARNGKVFSYQFGIRGEFTQGQGKQQGDLNKFSTRYFQPFPSLHLDYKITKSHNLSLGLNKRVDRPGYESLNPLTRIISNNNLQQGNPMLKPVVAYNADLWYGYKNTIYFGATYSYSRHDFTSVAVPLNAGVISTMPGNADYSGYATLQAMYGKQLLPWFYTSTTAVLSKRSFKGEFNTILLENNGLASLSATSYNSFSLSQNFSFMFLLNYRGKSMERTITTDAFAYLTAGMRQQLLNKRASVQLNIMDVFKSYRNYYQQNSGSIQQLWNYQFETRMFKVNLSYNFGGSIKNTRKSNSAEEERKRSTVNEN